MSGNFDLILKHISVTSSFYDKNSLLQNLKSYDEYIILSEDDTLLLSKKILLLPDKIQFIFFGKYVFNFSYVNIEELYSVENSKIELLYYENLFYTLFNLSENQAISEDSFKQASMTALKLSEQKLQDSFVTNKKKSLFLIFKKPLKFIASILLVFSIGFAVTFAVNADFREQVENFFYELFETFGVFQTHSVSETKDLEDYEITYIPDGFELESTISLPSSIAYYYVKSNTETISIFIGKSVSLFYVDTENVEIEELEFNDNKSYFYQKNQTNYLLFESNGNYIEVLGNVTKEELINISSKIE